MEERRDKPRRLESRIAALAEEIADISKKLDNVLLLLPENKEQAEDLARIQEIWDVGQQTKQ